MVRKFSLINEKGKEYSLMNLKKTCLLTEPAGLGYSYSTEYEQLGYEFLTNLRKLEQGAINGIVNFLNYDNFNEFTNFIETAKKLRFVYEVPFGNNSVTYYRDVNIRSLEKTERQKNGIISENIEFDCLSLWYEQNETIFKIEEYNDEIF